jgi:two-component system, OmpR family, sensor kinase
MRGVTEDRLTRQELGWLLMQEARGTARALRQEVGQLQVAQERGGDPGPPVETMLDALDGAIDMMTVLEAPSSVGQAHSKERRVRIDVVTLLFDVAPNARLAIEPGAGTEVFGVEPELRRMLNLLVKLSGSDDNAPSVISVHRETDWVIISVALGPEGMATRALEHRWLNRMALRHGGRVELTGNETKLFLPADAESGQQEILQLRKELEQAQQLGAVYAKELAEAFTFTSGDSGLPAPSSLAQPSAEAKLKLLVVSGAIIARTLRQTTELLKGDVNRISRLLGEPHELVNALQSRWVAYGELVADLDRIGRVTPEEPTKPLALDELLREVANSAEGRAKRQEVTVALDLGDHFTLTTRPTVLTLLLRSLFDQAIQSTPRRSNVTISLRRDDTPESKRYLLRVVDGGPPIPDVALPGLLQGTADASAIGRPSVLSWIVIGATTEALGLSVEVGESIAQRSEVRLTFC